MKRLALPVALIAVAAANSVYAETTNPDPGKYYATGTAHFLTTDHQRFADGGSNDGVGGHIGVGLKLSNLLSVELKVGAQRIHVNASGSKGQQDAILDLRYQLSGGATRTFALLGGGRTKTDLAGGGDASHHMMRFGLGFDYELSDNIDLRTQIVARHVDDSESVAGVDDFVDYETAVGLVYWFGGKSDTAKLNTSVVALPLLAAESEPASDDRTINSALQNVAGDAAIRFAHNSPTLNPIATAKLDKVAEILRNNPMAKAKVVGHTDDTDSLVFNVRLSEHRAAAAIAFLVGKGIRSDRLTKEAYGEVRPIGDNKTSAGRAANRRVEVLFDK